MFIECFDSNNNTVYVNSKHIDVIYEDYKRRTAVGVRRGDGRHFTNYSHMKMYELAKLLNEEASHDK